MEKNKTCYSIIRQKYANVFGCRIVHDNDVRPSTEPILHVSGNNETAITAAEELLFAVSKKGRGFVKVYPCDITETIKGNGHSQLSFLMGRDYHQLIHKLLRERNRTRTPGYWCLVFGQHREELDPIKNPAKIVGEAIGNYSSLCYGTYALNRSDRRNYIHKTIICVNPAETSSKKKETP